jgi:hypothetical protein
MAMVGLSISTFTGSAEVPHLADRRGMMYLTQNLFSIRTLKTYSSRHRYDAPLRSSIAGVYKTSEMRVTTVNLT